MSLSLDAARCLMRSASIIAAQVTFQLTGHPLLVQHGAAVDETALFAGYQARVADVAVTAELIAQIHAGIKQAVAEKAPLTRTTLDHGTLVQRLTAQKSLHSLACIELLNQVSYDVVDFRGWVAIAHHFATADTAALSHDGVAYGEQIEVHASGDGLWLRLSTLRPRLKVPAFDRAFEQVVSQTTAASFGAVARAALIPEGPASWLLAEEAQFDGRILHCAQVIHAQGKTKLILISGPSASGKTTFSYKLASALRALGHVPTVLSTDDYYQDARSPSYPRTPEGKPNHEVVEAMRLDDFGRDINALFAGEVVVTPIFDMKNSRPKAEGRRLSLPSHGILIMEGIFALDPKMTAAIPLDAVFKIFIVPIPTVNLDDITFMSNQDVRQLRRIARDYHHRGRDASASIARLATVRMGEELSILPNMVHADYVFNSTMTHELCILQVQCQALLQQVKPSDPSYPAAQRLRDYLPFGVPEGAISGRSLLREFIGGSVFDEDDTPVVHHDKVLTPTSAPDPANIRAVIAATHARIARTQALGFLIGAAVESAAPQLRALVRQDLSDIARNEAVGLYAELIDTNGEVVSATTELRDAIAAQLQRLTSTSPLVLNHATWSQAVGTASRDPAAAKLLTSVVVGQVIPVVSTSDATVTGIHPGYVACEQPFATNASKSSVALVEGLPGLLFTADAEGAAVTPAVTRALRALEEPRSAAAVGHGVTLCVGDLNESVLKLEVDNHEETAATLRGIQLQAIVDRVTTLTSARRVVLIAGNRALPTGADLSMKLRSIAIPSSTISLTAYVDGAGALNEKALAADVQTVFEAGSTTVTLRGGIAVATLRGGNGVLILLGSASMLRAVSRDVAGVKVLAVAVPSLNLTSTRVVSASDVESLSRLVSNATQRNMPATDTLIHFLTDAAASEGLSTVISEADIVYNTSSVLEVNNIATAAARLLRTVRPDHETFVEARRLLSLLEWFVPV